MRSSEDLLGHILNAFPIGTALAALSCREGFEEEIRQVHAGLERERLDKDLARESENRKRMEDGLRGEIKSLAALLAGARENEILLLRRCERLQEQRAA
jgi:hypothetical protein